MMSDLFNRAFEIVIGHEGGYVDNPADPGGETKYGISHRSYPHEDIKGMTLDRAKDLYYNDFWLPLQAFDLPDRIAILLFDMAVNMGKTRAVMVLQRAAGVKDDGLLGPVSRAAIKAKDELELIAEVTVQRIMYYTSLETFGTFGLGWTRRAIRLMGQV